MKKLLLIGLFTLSLIKADEITPLEKTMMQNQERAQLKNNSTTNSSGNENKYQYKYQKEKNGTGNGSMNMYKGSKGKGGK